MRSYAYSIFSRFFLAGSGFLVFIVTAALFGPDGRGTIGYGTSLFAIAGLILSGNLGRSFVEKTRLNHSMKKSLIRRFLKLHVGLSVSAGVLGLAYWYFSDSAQAMLTQSQALWLSLTTFFYTWSVNGNSFFAGFGLSRIQENIIIATRAFLIFLIAILYYSQNSFLDFFISGYSIILFLGFLSEISFLWRVSSSESKASLFSNRKILRESLIHHLDYLSFNLFPLYLLVVSALFIPKSDVGQLNFSIQLLNLIFLLSTTAHIKVTDFVANHGLEKKMKQVKKLFYLTAALSLIAVPLLHSLVSLGVRSHFLASFDGVGSLLLIGAVSLPGYILYQFLAPLWIELNKQSLAAKIHSYTFLLFIFASPVFLRSYGLKGAIWLFSLFHFGLLFCQAFLVWKNRKNPLIKSLLT